MATRKQAADTETDRGQPARVSTSFGSQPGYEGDADEKAGWTVADATKRKARTEARIFRGQ